MKRGSEKARSGRARAPAAGGSAPRGRKRRGRWPAALAALAAASLAGLAVWRLAPGRPAAAPDPLADVTALAAADSADRLIAAGRNFEALPYIARVERIAVETTADFDARAATAQCNATIQVIEKDGMVIPVTRSTVERVTMVRQALIRLEVAEGKATNPVQKRNILAARAGQLTVWGLAREGYAEYRRAHELQPLDRRQLSEAGWIEKMLGDPTQDLKSPVP